ncbi:Papain fold toxin 1, glutamine deamidase [Amycolatopsis xylanica]|uniref:Papain fold toxin 1, glutamine deamidase n=1 Tax=Amycolatopsis xylanica TaxID=589385 RepID=A0A1H3ASI1_9PSEU|nr:toxin glutamine deamidase domain-containing protein [Amycolatopsis xylanica]SDX31809.1 Papain fold toxin 1, glutamine deamidase [Amycolatopsis xylanica]
MEMPDEVKWLLPIVVGESWPEGDEDKLRELAKAWHSASEALSPVAQMGSTAAKDILANWTGDSAQAFGEQWKKFVDGDEAYFKSLGDAAKALGDSCDQTALDVEYTKYMIIISLIILAAQIVAMIAAAAPSLGTSTAGIPIAQAATRVTVQMLFRQLMEKVAQQGFKMVAKELLQTFLKQGLKKIAKEVAVNVAMNVGMDAGIQGLQMAKGDRKEWDWNKTKDGAISGAVGGVIGAGTGSVSKAMRGEEGFGVVGQAVKGAVEGAGETIGTAAVTGKLGELKLSDIAMGASGGAVGGGVDGAKEHFKSVNSPEAPHVNSPNGPDSSPDPAGRTSNGDSHGGDSSSRTPDSSSSSNRTSDSRSSDSHSSDSSSRTPDSTGDSAARSGDSASRGSDSSSHSSEPARGGEAPSQRSAEPAPQRSETPQSESAPQHRSADPAPEHRQADAPDRVSQSSTQAPERPADAPAPDAQRAAAPPPQQHAPDGGQQQPAPAQNGSPASGPAPAQTGAPAAAGHSPSSGGPAPVSGGPAPVSGGGSTGGHSPVSSGGQGPAPVSSGGHGPSSSGPAPVSHTSSPGYGAAPPHNPSNGGPAPTSGGYGMAPPPGGFGPGGGGNRQQHNESVQAAGLNSNTPQPQQPNAIQPFGGGFQQHQAPPPPPPQAPAPPMGGGGAPRGPMPPRQPAPPPPPRQMPPQDPRRGNYAQPDPRQQRPMPPQPPQRGPVPPPPPQRGPVPPPPPRGNGGQPPRPPQGFQPPPPQQPRPPMPPGQGRGPMPPQQRPPMPPPVFERPGQRPGPAFPSYRGDLNEPPAPTRHDAPPQQHQTPPRVEEPAPQRREEAAAPRREEQAAPPRVEENVARHEEPVAKHDEPTRQEPEARREEPTRQEPENRRDEPARQEPEAARHEEPAKQEPENARHDEPEAAHHEEPTQHEPETTKHDEAETSHHEEPGQQEPDGTTREVITEEEPPWSERTPEEAARLVGDRIHPDEAYLGNDKFHTQNPDDIKSIRDTHMEQDLRGQELRHEEIYRQAIAIRDHVEAFGRMSDDGAYAVRTYTHHEVFANLNAALREGRLTPELVAQARAIISGLNELPPYEGETVRTMNFHGDKAAAKLASDHFRVGQVTVEHSFSSSSKVDEHHQNSAFEGEVELRVKSKTGREIDGIAAKANEREVLYKPGTQLLVTKKEFIKNADGEVIQTIIHAEEIGPDHPKWVAPEEAQQRIAERREQSAAAESTSAVSSRLTTVRTDGQEGGQSRSHETDQDRERARQQELIRQSLQKPEAGWSALNGRSDTPGIHAESAQSTHQQVRFLHERLPEVEGINRNHWGEGDAANGRKTNGAESVLALEKRLSGDNPHAVADANEHPGDPRWQRDMVRGQLGGDWAAHESLSSALGEMAGKPIDSRAIIAFESGQPPQTHMVTAVTTEHGVAVVDPMRNRLAELPADASNISVLPTHDPSAVKPDTAPRSADLDGSNRINERLGTNEHRSSATPEVPSNLHDRLGTRLESDAPAPAEQAHNVSDRLDGKATEHPGGYGAESSADGLVDGGATGNHDWSPLAQATNPPSEPAIHAGTANQQQAANYVAQRHPELRAVNPHFYDPNAFNDGYQTNCTRGVVAYAKRLLGLDVTAEPILPHEMATKGTLEHVQQQLGGEWQSHSDYDSVIRTMRDEPIGSHAVVGVLYQTPDGQTFGHVAMAVHTEEGVAFIDPQSGTLMNLPHPPVKLDLLPFGSLEHSDGAASPSKTHDQPVASADGSHAAAKEDALPTQDKTAEQPTAEPAKAHEDTATKTHEEAGPAETARPVDPRAEFAKPREDTPSVTREDARPTDPHAEATKPREDSPAVTREDARPTDPRVDFAKPREDAPAVTREEARPAETSRPADPRAEFAKPREDAPAVTREDARPTDPRVEFAKPREDAPAVTREEPRPAEHTKPREEAPAVTRQDPRVDFAKPRDETTSQHSTPERPADPRIEFAKPREDVRPESAPRHDEASPQRPADPRVEFAKPREEPAYDVRPSRIGPDGRPVPTVSHTPESPYGAHEPSHQREWPHDPESDRPLNQRDMDFLGLTDEQIENWRNGEAPLGMTPEQFRDFQSSLADVLAPFGIRPEDALVQIVGSAVRGCSGWTKRMDNIEHTPESRQRLAEWLGDGEGPVRRPFDAMHKLGLDKPSDYDVSFHSDRMVEIARQHWRSEGSPGEFSHKHGFVDKKIFHDAFRELDEWTKHWEEQLGRKVGVRLFGLEEEPMQRRSPNSSSNDDAWRLDLSTGEHHTPHQPDLRAWPTDPVSGYRILPRDMEFLGYTEEQVENWRSGAAPMGMTPAQFHEFKASLHEAMRADGIAIDGSDVRLKGSGVNFFSNKRKELPSLEQLDAEHPEAAARMREWLGEDANRPHARPFDSMHKLGLDPDPSDFDIQIRSDEMSQRARERFETDPPEGVTSLTHPKYRFIDKALMNEVFPHLADWVERWEGELGREVAPALFGLDGEPRQDSFDDPERAKRGWPIAGLDAPPEHGGYGMAHEPHDLAEHPRLDPESPVVTEAPESPPVPPKEEVADPVIDDSGWHWKGLTLDVDTNAIVDGFIPQFADAAHREDGVLSHIKTIEAAIPGAQLEGLKYELKGDDRLKQKVAEVLARNPDQDPVSVLRTVPDGIRYTYCFDTANYAAGAQQADAMLRAAGYEPVEVKNSWLNPDKPYQGINTRWRDPVSGLQFEVQYHTPESWYVKSETHDAYEHANNQLISAEQRQAWDDFQKEWFDLIEVPEGVEEIPNAKY